nr:GntR family transcriptional regulator [uncultured Desulfobacter sp.]
MNTDHLINFTPVMGTKKAEAIRLQIEAAIQDNLFMPGDRLPSERELQDAFKTSRGSVREALGALKQKGLLEARKGARGGYYIREIDINDTIDQLAVMIKHQQMPLAKLLEFQYAMDQAVLAAALTNGKPSDIDQLDTLADELVLLCGAPDPDYEQISALDKKLNLLMVKMTKNPFFEWMMRSVQLTFRSYEFVVYQTPSVRNAIALNWKNVAKAVRNRDFQRSTRLYGHWYVLLEQCLRKQFGDTVFEETPVPPKSADPEK